MSRGAGYVRTVRPSRAPTRLSARRTARSTADRGPRPSGRGPSGRFDVVNDAPLLFLITDPLVDDDDVEIGLLVPATPGPGAEEDSAINGRFGHEVPAEGDGSRVGPRMADPRHLFTDAVSPHRSHGAVTSSQELGGGYSEGCWRMSPRLPLRSASERVKDAR